MTLVVDAAENYGLVECWCCGCTQPETSMVRLGNHPEVGVCLRCAHYLHQQAWSREDTLRSSPGVRARGALRAARRVVMQQGWQQRRMIGPLLRWLGRHLP